MDGDVDEGRATATPASHRRPMCHEDYAVQHNGLEPGCRPLREGNKRRRPPVTAPTIGRLKGLIPVKALVDQLLKKSLISWLRISVASLIAKCPTPGSGLKV